MRDFWISAYTQDGQQFGESIEANSVDELFTIFKEKHPGCEIADYDEYEEVDDWYYYDALENMPCDTYGPAACTESCPNYAKCMGWEK